MTLPLAAHPGLAAAQGAFAKKRVVCWTDDNGNRACGDAVPPRYAAREREVLDEHGRVVRTIPAQLSSEQRAAQAADNAEAEAARREADKQEAYDRALLATYAKPEELAALRDDRLTTLDTTLDLTNKALARDRTALEQLRSRQPPADSGKPVPVALQNNIAQFEKQVADGEHSVAVQTGNRAQICATFERDIRRFQELKTGTVAFSSPCPEAGSLSALRTGKVDLDGAKKFFGQFVALERDYDPQRLELYAGNAVIRRAGGGASQPVEQSLADYRAQVLKDLPTAKRVAESQTYADVKFEAPGDGTARISGTRASSTQPDRPLPFVLVVKPTGQGWKIVEDSLGVAS